jgi:hypothetical protein
MGVTLTDLNLMVKTVALWPTTTRDHKNGDAHSCQNVPVNGALGRIVPVIVAMWSTIRATDGEKGGPNMTFGAGGSPLPSQVSETHRSLNVPTENGAGSLHPEFAGWELGYPPAYLDCAPLATASTKGRRKRFSGQSSKR